MIRANDNLAILSAEAPINSPLMTDGSAFVQLQEEFRSAFETTVVDLPRNMLINFPHLLSEVNVMALVTEMTLASARDTIRILSWLKANAPGVNPIVVANKVQTGATEISRADFEASIERKINFLIPYDQKAAINAAKLGQTFVDANRSSKSGAAIRDVAKAILVSGEDGAGADESETGNASLLAKFDFKSLLGKKGKGKAAAAAE
jgi:pilus assembly protein CpaE